MTAPAAVDLADTVLALHLVVIGFNVFGLVAIPLGAWRGWRFVRVAWWRWLHVAALAAVAGQALAGRACFLTLGQDALLGRGGHAPPLIMRWVDGVIFWPLPLWVFAVLYVLVWLYVLALLWAVPPAWPRWRRARHDRRRT
jgi:Protein of Unknown function (DUF2784)